MIGKEVIFMGSNNPVFLGTFTKGSKYKILDTKVGPSTPATFFYMYDDNGNINRELAYRFMFVDNFICITNEVLGLTYGKTYKLFAMDETFVEVINDNAIKTRTQYVFFKSEYDARMDKLNELAK